MTDVASAVFSGMPLAYETASKVAASVSLQPPPANKSGAYSLRGVVAANDIPGTYPDRTPHTPRETGFQSLDGTLQRLRVLPENGAVKESENEKPLWEQLLDQQKENAEVRRERFEEEAKTREAAQDARRQEIAEQLATREAAQQAATEEARSQAIEEQISESYNGNTTATQSAESESATETTAVASTDTSTTETSQTTQTETAQATVNAAPSIPSAQASLSSFETDNNDFELEPPEISQLDTQADPQVQRNQERISQATQAASSTGGSINVFT